MPVQIYSWADWSNGELWVLHQGVDFDVEPRSFAKSARKYAHRYGMKAKTSIYGESVCVQFFEAEAEEE